MVENNRKGFRTVKEVDMEDYRKKIREHRWKVLRSTALIFFILFLIVAGLGLFVAFRHYTDFDIRTSFERADTDATRFAEFRGNILKYSNDGAFYIDTQNELIWNQTYEMSNPQIDICEDYLVLYDKKGTKIYILTSGGGLQGSIETTMPINQVCVASQGTVAVLMEKGRAGYLALYDRAGNNLAQGEIHGEKGGYPIAIALSHDAIKLAVSMLDINSGSVKSTIAFYNYGSVGQNEIDNCVGVNFFADMVIPELEFISDDRMVALGDSKMVIFEGSQKPQPLAEIPLEKQAKSVFHSQDYIGVVSGNDDEAVTHHLKVFDTRGNLVMEKDFGLEYTSIEFLSNNEICIQNETMCDIYTIRGVYKFHYEFDRKLYRVLPGGMGLNYTFVLEGMTKKVRLK
ncbi:MAG: DUF5711 family protein [Roseburia sp.]